MLADDSKAVGQFDSKTNHRALANQNETDSHLSEAHNMTKKEHNESLNPSSSPKPATQDIVNEDGDGREPHINPDDLIELQERITKEILNSKLKEKEMLELQVSFQKRILFSYPLMPFQYLIYIFIRQENINREILNSKLFNGDANGKRRKRKRKNQRAVSGDPPALSNSNVKARSLMNLHNNEAGRRVRK